MDQGDLAPPEQLLKHQPRANPGASFAQGLQNVTFDMTLNTYKSGPKTFTADLKHARWKSIDLN